MPSLVRSASASSTWSSPPGAAVLHGIDPEGNRSTALVQADAAQFVVKVLRMKPPAKRRPVNFHLPKK